MMLVLATNNTVIVTEIKQTMSLGYTLTFIQVEKDLLKSAFLFN